MTDTPDDYADTVERMLYTPYSARRAMDDDADMTHKALKITERGEYVEVDPETGAEVETSPEMAELGELIKTGLAELGDDDDDEPTNAEREQERADRIARAKRYADKAGDEGLFAETRAAWAAAGMLELAIVQAEDPRFAPPF